MLVSIRQRKFTSAAVLGLGVTLVAAVQLRADTVYGANTSTNQIQVIDTTASTVSTVTTDANTPRGLTFTDANNIVYTTTATPTLADYNLQTHKTTVLNPNLGVNAVGGYVVLDPGSGSVTFDAGANIERYTLGTAKTTTVAANVAGRGLAYDSKGDLFAVLGSDEVAQINPQTGAVLKSITVPSTGGAGANGLAFDPVTGELFFTDDGNSLASRGLWEISTSLASPTLVNKVVAANGLVADGKGDLWIADVDNLDEFNTKTLSLTVGVADPGLFDVAVAPSSSGGPPPPPPPTVPEPVSTLMIGGGLAAIAIARRFRGRS